jgi:hypothetical protein
MSRCCRGCGCRSLVEQAPGVVRCSKCGWTAKPEDGKVGEKKP